EADRAGFYGLDLYSLYTSMHGVLAYLETRLPELAAEGRARYACLAPFEGEPDAYGHAVVTRQYGGCEDEAVAMLQDLLTRRLDDGFAERERLFDATENARVVRDAERYYRAMFHGSALSWNLRDTHMMDTLEAIRRHRSGAKAVVWAHNSHLGDAAHTQMGRQGEINLGHLCRAHYGEGAYLVGFGTHTGTVAAAHTWGGDVQTMAVRPSRDDAYEGLCHRSGVSNFFLPLRTADDTLREALTSPRLERAIGVIYRPETERLSHYFEAVLPRQFDEYVWFDETRAVTPLGPSHAPTLPQRHPFRLLAD
ncbi:MAG TPA: erythromycin esterase family protein, partial [Rhodothermales bacterium]|nr:erythromycin esterase family protein [Rhodothermales bacterium]